MIRTGLISLILALMLGWAAPVGAHSACEDPLGCVELGADDPIVIGAMLVVSGANSALGLDAQGGVELAIEARGGMLLEREIEMVVEDSLCSAEGGQAAAQRLAADPSIIGIIGTSCSSAAQGALPIVNAAGMLMIAPSNTSPSLTNEDTASGGVYLPGYFRTSPNDLIRSAKAAEYAIKVLGVASLATVHDGDTYTEGATRVMAERFAELGGDVVFSGAVNKGDTDMTAILTEIAASGPDIVYFPLFEPESNFFGAQMATTPGLEDAVMMTAAASFVESFPENTGDAAIGIYMSGPLVGGDAYEAFLTTWLDEFGESPPSGYHAHAYDAANILLDAIEASAVASDDGDLTIGRSALRDAVHAVEDYPGLTGALTCYDESPYAGDCGSVTAMAIFHITEAEVYDGNWPPPAVWNFATDSFEDA
ncbi:MAG: branched-chain amino acid ABC transporter substrate-binding protein [Chloroflexi bacterium]|nr:branched-chain amino acid ABC transporter substrate-binding protein [Chloroflexota bacterium]